MISMFLFPVKALVLSSTLARVAVTMQDFCFSGVTYHFLGLSSPVQVIFLQFCHHCCGIQVFQRQNEVRLA